jgi:ABC-type siderophore export system fused ATPase/permease subunit
MCQDSGLRLSDFGILELRIPEFKKKIMEQLKKKHNWKGDIYSLRDRIYKRLSETNFTAREQRSLRRMLKSYQKGLKTIEEITKKFPGKTQAQVLHYNSLFFRKKRAA